MVNDLRYKDLQILIVEDDYASRIFLSKLVNKLTSNIVEAENGLVGLKKYQEKDFDLVITDIAMPMMNGLDMARKIKQINSKTQIILTTAFDNKEFLLEAIDIGVSQFVAKPVDFDSFLKAFKRATEIIFLQKEVEEANRKLKNQNEELEQKVKERTKELIEINQKLQREIENRIRIEHEILQAKEFAEKANKAKSAFLAKVSHELRTPLNGIIGISSILHKSITDKKSIEFIELIKSSGESLLTIINDILDYTKIESGKLNISLHKFNIKELLNSVIELNTISTSDKGINLIYDIDDLVPEIIESDSGRIRQILMNLISNAIKFTEKGEIKVSLILNGVDEDKIELLFKVSDTGIGIPKSNWDSIFNSFTQVDNSLTRKYGGTGLGLSISKELTELLGGKIWFESFEGIGSIFYFTIKAKGFIDASSLDSKKEKVENSINFSKCFFDYPITILLADDSEINQKVFQAHIENDLWKVICVKLASEAIELAKNANIDIIFMDIHLPDFKGYEAAKIIKDYNKSIDKYIPIIGFTGDLTDFTIANCFQAGMDDIIEKPITQNKVLENLYNFLSPKAEILNNSCVYSLEKLKRITKSNFSAFNEIINHLINKSQTELNNLEIFIKDNNFEKIKEESHRLKSEYLNIDALKAAKLLEAIEIKSKFGKIEEMSYFYSLLKEEVQLITNSLIEYTKNSE